MTNLRFERSVEDPSGTCESERVEAAKSASHQEALERLQSGVADAAVGAPPDGSA